MFQGCPSFFMHVLLQVCDLRLLPALQLFEMDAFIGVDILGLTMMKVRRLSPHASFLTENTSNGMIRSHRSFSVDSAFYSDSHCLAHCSCISHPLQVYLWCEPRLLATAAAILAAGELMRLLVCRAISHTLVFQR